MAETLNRWLATVPGPSLFLGWGWHGRPYDNAHELTASLLTPGQLALQFDHHLLVVATGYESIEVDSRSPRPGSPLAADPLAAKEWTTLTVDGISLLTFISSDSDSATWDDAAIRSDRDTYFMLIAPRPEVPPA